MPFLHSHKTEAFFFFLSYLNSTPDYAIIMLKRIVIFQANLGLFYFSLFNLSVSCWQLREEPIRAYMVNEGKLQQTLPLPERLSAYSNFLMEKMHS